MADKNTDKHGRGSPEQKKEAQREKEAERETEQLDKPGGKPASPHPGFTITR